MGEAARVIDMTASPGTMFKPARLIEVRGVGRMTLEQRRAYNLLVHHAWGPKILDPSHVFSIASKHFHVDGGPHLRHGRLDACLSRLQRTLIKVQLGGRTRSLQLLSTFDIETNVNDGFVHYSFPNLLGQLLQDETIFAELDMAVMRGFRSKYAHTLYEHVARRANMRFKFTEEFTIDELREVLGIERGKLTEQRNFKNVALDPALKEVNEISPYQVSIVPKKERRRIVGYTMGWNKKPVSELRRSHAALEREFELRKRRKPVKASA